MVYTTWGEMAALPTISDLQKFTRVNGPKWLYFFLVFDKAWDNKIT